MPKTESGGSVHDLANKLKRQKDNVHAHKLQDLIIAVHETQMREPSRDPNPKQRRDDHLRQRQRDDRAPWKSIARTHPQARERATEAYQTDRDARRADKVGRVEDEGQRRLPVGRDGPKARLEAR